MLTAGPVLLVPACDALPDAVDAELTRLDAERIVALGGREAVCAFTLDAAATRVDEALAERDLAGPAN